MEFEITASVLQGSFLDVVLLDQSLDLEVLEREGFGSGSGFDFCLLILSINYLLQLL